MKIGIEPRSKEEIGGTDQYRRLVTFFFWLEERLVIPYDINLEVAIVHKQYDKRIGAVTSSHGSKELKMMLNTHYFNQENLNSVTGRYEDWFTTIAHEMVHVKQWATGELSYEGGFYWYSERYHRDTSKLSYQEYLDLPWENEAFSRQNSLYQEWMADGEPNGLT